MSFDFTPDQYALRDVARDLFVKGSPPSRLRGIWEGLAPGREVWSRIADVGIAGLTIDERHGGAGGDLVDLALVLEEAGRAALPEPIVETAVIAAAVAPDDWLSRIASGEVLAAVADGPFVPHADAADLLIAVDGDGAVAVPRDAYGVTLVRTVDRARPVFTVERVRDIPLAASAARIRALGAAATACVLNGVSMRLIEMTVEHAKDRHQFGTPVGSFQAVKHKLASMHTLVESARPAAWYACYALARSLPDAAGAVHVAKSVASDAHAFVNQEALQCHGGIGFTWEHDLHLWLKRGKSLEHAFGGAAEHRRALAARLLG